MKHTEDEIVAIAKSIMEEIGWDYNTQEKVEALAHPLQEYIDLYKDMKEFDQIKDTLRADWLVFLNFPKGWIFQNI